MSEGYYGYIVENKKIILYSYLFHLIGWLFVVIPPMIADQWFLSLSRGIVFAVVGLLTTISAMLLFDTGSIWLLVIPVVLGLLQPLFIALIVIEVRKVINR